MQWACFRSLQGTTHQVEPCMSPAATMVQHSGAHNPPAMVALASASAMVSTLLLSSPRLAGSTAVAGHTPG
jgi:hypothetical protein